MIDPSYQEKIQKHREDREKWMTANPRNWFSLAGLFWLEAGDNPFGSDESNKIILPTLNSATCGVFHHEMGKVTLTGVEGEGIKVNGQTPGSRPLRTDHDDAPDLIETGSLVMMVIQRGEHLFLRVWDKEAQVIKNFKGLNYYPVNPEYCIPARFNPYDPPRVEKTQDVIGTEYDSKFTGQAIFIINSVECTLEAQDNDDELLFSFTDPTKTDTTYPGGRFLNTAKPKNGQVMLDFNLATNWPCAYTSYVTCPLPPFENRLTVRIEAGEIKYHD